MVLVLLFYIFLYSHRNCKVEQLFENQCRHFLQFTWKINLTWKVQCSTILWDFSFGRLWQEKEKLKSKSDRILLITKMITTPHFWIISTVTITQKIQTVQGSKYKFDFWWNTECCARFFMSPIDRVSLSASWRLRQFFRRVFPAAAYTCEMIKILKNPKIECTITWAELRIFHLMKWNSLIWIATTMCDCICCN